MLQDRVSPDDQGKVSRRLVHLLASTLSERPILYALGIGITLRILTAMSFWGYWNSEAQSVAVALASGRGFADTWYVGQGPTAHLMPVGPSLVALTYFLFGHDGAGEFLRISYAIIVTIGCYALAAFCCMLAGARPSLCKAAFIFLLIIPVHNFTESVRWQDWEGGLATLFGLFSLALLLASEKGHRYPAERILRCTLPAMTFLINPIIGLAVGLATALFVYRHRREIGFFGPMLASLTCAAILVAPWAARNHLVLGSPIVTRSNLGLELAVANHPDAVSSTDPANTFINRIRQIHPHQNPMVQLELERAGGEIAYNKLLLHQTTDWIRDNPLDIVRIWTRHLKEIFFRPDTFF